MAVEIQILSGSRQGERVELDQRQFVVGSDPASEIFFDPQNDPPAKDRAAQFQLADDGWTVKNLGAGDLLLNQQPVGASAHVRSGDVVRLSNEGPDFTFTILAHATGAAAAAAGAAAAQTAAADSPATEPTAPAEAAQPSPAVSGPTVVVPLAVVGGLVLCLAVLAVGWRMMSGDKTAANDQPPAKTEKPDRPKDGPADPAAEAKPDPAKPTTDDGKQPAEKPQTPAVTPPEKPPVEPVKPVKPITKPNGTDWDAVLADVRPSVCLLQAVHPSGQATWPVANACAIRDDTLLTTGTAASALANFRKQGWKITVRTPASAIQHPIKDLRVHKGYQQMPEKLEEGQKDPRMYFDLALVTVEPKPAPLKPLGLGAAAEGLAVADVGIPYDAQRVSSLESYSADVYKGKIFRIDMLGAEPGSPVVLDVTTPIPLPEGKALGPYFVGSPLLDAKKQIVGLYSSPPLSPEAMQLEIHHFVETGLVKLWLAGKDPDSWVEPIVPEPPAEPKPSKRD